MFFKKDPKKETVESLMKDCNKAYGDFLYAYTLAHYKQYFYFKGELKDGFDLMKATLHAVEDEKITLALLRTFKEQLTFINKNPFSAEPDEIRDFIHKHFPYKDKIKAIICENKSTNKTEYRNENNNLNSKKYKHF